MTINAHRSSAIRRGDWELIEFFEGNSLQFSNLRAAPAEADNLLSKKPARARELQAALAA